MMDGIACRGGGGRRSTGGLSLIDRRAEVRETGCAPCKIMIEIWVACPYRVIALQTDDGRKRGGGNVGEGDGGGVGGGRGHRFPAR